MSVDVSVAFRALKRFLKVSFTQSMHLNVVDSKEESDVLKKVAVLRKETKKQSQDLKLAETESRKLSEAVRQMLPVKNQMKGIEAQRRVLRLERCTDEASSLEELEGSDSESTLSDESIGTFTFLDGEIEKIRDGTSSKLVAAIELSGKSNNDGDIRGLGGGRDR